MVHPKVATWECPDCEARVHGGVDAVVQMAKDHYAAAHPIAKAFHFPRRNLQRKLREMIQEPG